MFRRHALSFALLGTPAASQASAQGCDTSIEVVNSSDAQVDELYFNPTSSSNWGRDRLGENVLTPGRKVSFRPGHGGDYEFRVVWSGGRTRKSAVSTSARSAASSSAAGRGSLLAE